MTATHELDAVMRETIEEPAAARLLTLVRRGLVREADVQRFRVSSRQFKSAILAGYESFDPEVRSQLRISLLQEYQITVNSLVTELIDRDATTAGDDVPALPGAASPPPDDPADSPESRMAAWWRQVMARLPQRR